MVWKKSYNSSKLFLMLVEFSSMLLVCTSMMAMSYSLPTSFLHNHWAPTNANRMELAVQDGESRVRLVCTTD